LRQQSTGIDLTKPIINFNRKFLASITDIDAFILKTRSPSCGTRDTKIFRAVSDKKHAYRGKGMFAQAVLKRYSDTIIEDEDRLNEPRYREHFLIKLFTYARFRETKKSNRFMPFEDFHKKNSLLLDTHSHRLLKEMDRIASSSRTRTTRNKLTEYERCLHKALSRRARIDSHLRVVQRILESMPAIKSHHQMNLSQLFHDVALKLITPWEFRSDLRKKILTSLTGELQQQTYFAPYPFQLEKYLSA
jgi:uncharacterized protein YbgA (DUF1722 family)